MWLYSMINLVLTSVSSSLHDKSQSQSSLCIYFLVSVKSDEWCLNPQKRRNRLACQHSLDSDKHTHTHIHAAHTVVWMTCPYLSGTNEPHHFLSQCTATGSDGWHSSLGCCLRLCHPVRLSPLVPWYQCRQQACWYSPSHLLATII